jgi:prepilin-type N-terminal cleavage/methylation domain-containing protein
MYCFKPIRPARGFTLLEVVTALLILGTICATVLTVMNQAITTAIDLRKRTQAFEVARENMENLLCLVTVSDTSDFGTHPLYPDIEWETTIEPFTEPASNKMWIQAVCTASYPDSAGEIQEVTLTHWLTGLSDKQIRQILDQQKREGQYLDMLGVNDKTRTEQAAIRRYLRAKGVEVKPYTAVLTDQSRLKKQWIKEFKDDPDTLRELMESVRQAEYEWLDTIGFNWDDFFQWRLENPDPELPKESGGKTKKSAGDSEDTVPDPTGGTPTQPGKGNTDFDKAWNSGNPMPEGQ